MPGTRCDSDTPATMGGRRPQTRGLGYGIRIREATRTRIREAFGPRRSPCRARLLVAVGKQRVPQCVTALKTESETWMCGAQSGRLGSREERTTSIRTEAPHWAWLDSDTLRLQVTRMTGPGWNSRTPPLADSGKRPAQVLRGTPLCLVVPAQCPRCRGPRAARFGHLCPRPRQDLNSMPRICRSPRASAWLAGPPCCALRRRDRGREV